MNTITARKQISFRLNSELLEKLKEEAVKENRSLNNFIENILMEVVNYKPNKETLQAMKDAKNDKDLEVLELTNFDNYVTSL